MELSPYFKAVARIPHLCPECGHALVLRPLERTWDGAMWKCERCKWFQVETAPEAARMGERTAPAAHVTGVEKLAGGAKIVAVDFGRGRR